MDPTRAEVCAVAIADAFKDDGEIFGSPMGMLPTLARRWRPTQRRMLAMLDRGNAHGKAISSASRSSRPRSMRAWTARFTRSAASRTISGVRHQSQAVQTTTPVRAPPIRRLPPGWKNSSAASSSCVAPRRCRPAT